MPGSPKKRARRLALEAAKAEARRPPVDVGAHTIPQPKADPIIDWIEGGEAPELQSIEDADPIVGSLFPGVSDEPELLTNKDKLFTELLGLTFDRALDIMKIKPGDDAFTPQVLTRQASIIASMLSTTARIDEARLRGRGKNKIDEILKAIQAEGK